MTKQISEYSLYRDIFTGTYTVLLLGGEFGNCYGQGSTPEMAVTGLKIRMYQLRRKDNHEQTKIHLRERKN